MSGMWEEYAQFQQLQARRTVEVLRWEGCAPSHECKTLIESKIPFLWFKMIQLHFN